MNFRLGECRSEKADVSAQNGIRSEKGARARAANSGAVWFFIGSYTLAPAQPIPCYWWPGAPSLTREYARCCRHARKSV
jgi:hypothetical protein